MSTHLQSVSPTIFSDIRFKPGSKSIPYRYFGDNFGQTRRYNFERLPLNDERRFWGCLLKLYLRVCPKLAILTLIQASLSKASLQDPGILNSPKTVLHSLLGILSNKEIRQENAALIQYGYELIYKICSNSGTFLIGSPIARHHYLTFDWLIG